MNPGLAMCFQQYVIRRVDTEGEDYIVDSEEGFATIGSHGGAGKIGRHEGVGTVDSNGGACTVIGQEAAGLDGGSKKEDDESLFYGTHEILEYEAYKGEEHLQEDYDNCKKNPGHEGSVFVNKFNISHMPEGQQDEDMVKFIKATADLTVRVEVKAVSTARPRLWPNTDQPFPYHNKADSTGQRLGTGKVCYVKKWIEDKNRGTCKCLTCQHSDTPPSKVWGEIMFYTATHVVFDDLEARETTCRFFFDSRESRYIELDGWTMGMARINTDKCVLKCVTCDVGLLDVLVKMRKRWRDLFFKKYTKDQPIGFDNRMLFIVSHPHGCPKMVSVGQWKDMVVGVGWRTKFTYTTCTCPGSSGAYVHPLMYDPLLYYYHHVHSGVNTAGLNVSGFGRETPLL